MRWPELTVRDIRALGEDNYEVKLEDEAGATELIVCHVFQHRGIWAASMEPDLVMGPGPARIDSRAVVSAVVAYHQSLTGNR